MGHCIHRMGSCKPFSFTGWWSGCGAGQGAKFGIDSLFLGNDKFNLGGQSGEWSCSAGRAVLFMCCTSSMVRQLC